VKKKVVTVGIISREDFKNRMDAILRGEYTTKKDEPKIWFESLKVLGEVLSDRNQELLRVILKHEPDSLKELAVLTGRQVSNLSRSLSNMENIGLVKLTRNGRRVKPHVVATDFRVEFGLGIRDKG
jgi:predicted transcriptional regulator